VVGHVPGEGVKRTGVLAGVGPLGAAHACAAAGWMVGRALAIIRSSWVRVARSRIRTHGSAVVGAPI
jgi:hypothetical protein